jgi:hypothetical protein
LVGVFNTGVASSLSHRLAAGASSSSSQPLSARFLPRGFLADFFSVDSDVSFPGRNRRDADVDGVASDLSSPSFLALGGASESLPSSTDESKALTDNWNRFDESVSDVI